MSAGTVLLLLGGGLVAGFVNTVAGGGSVVTIPILIELTGSASIANGTNRIAILLQNVVGVTGFARGGKMPWRRVLPLIPATVLGAVAGAWLATSISPAGMKRVFAVVILLVAASVLIKPKRWLSDRERAVPEPWRFLIFFGAGFYGGFVQAGVGFLLLAGLVLGGGMDLVRGNAAKLFLVLSYTPVALLFFFDADQVELASGLVLAVGNMTGAFIAARLAVKKGGDWIRYALVVAAVGAAVRMLLV